MHASDAEILSALDDVTDEKESPVAAPADVAEELPIGREAVRQRLNRIHHRDDGIRSRKVGRSRVFWTWKAWEHDDDRHGDAPDDRDITDITADERCDYCNWGPAAIVLVDGDWECYNCGHDPDEPEPVPTVAGDDVQEESDDDRPDEWLDDLDEPPASTREEFEEAAVKVVQRVTERGELTRKQAQEALHEDYPAGYASNARTWWRRVAKPVLEAHPEVKSPPSGGSKWRIVA